MEGHILLASTVALVDVGSLLLLRRGRRGRGSIAHGGGGGGGGGRANDAKAGVLEEVATEGVARVDRRLVAGGDERTAEDHVVTLVEAATTSVDAE